jgi:hypothetical protein
VDANLPSEMRKVNPSGRYSPGEIADVLSLTSVPSVSDTVVRTHARPDWDYTPTTASVTTPRGGTTGERGAPGGGIPALALHLRRFR